MPLSWFFRAALGATAAMSLFGAVAVSEAELGSHRDPIVGARIPAPIAGEGFFAPTEATYWKGEICLTADHAFDALVLDVEHVGGQIVLMTDGAQQDFSDAWRGLVGKHRVEVALVLAHFIPNPGGGDPSVDVIEIGAHGCTISRTLLTAGNWLKLIELARSIEA